MQPAHVFVCITPVLVKQLKHNGFILLALPKKVTSVTSELRWYESKIQPQSCGLSVHSHCAGDGITPPPGF